jgi:hypothetical protein
VCVKGLLGDAERTADERMEILASARDPRTGENPFALIARREDLPSLGLPCEGPDVVSFFKAGYSELPLPRDPEEKREMIEKKDCFRPWAFGIHRGLPTIGYKHYSNAGTFLISGDGVPGDRELPYPVHLKDVTPTLCHLLDAPPPRDSEGRILWEVLPPSTA